MAKRRVGTESVSQPERLLREITTRLKAAVRDRQVGLIDDAQFTTRMAELEKAAGELDKARRGIATLRLSQGLQEGAERRAIPPLVRAADVRGAGQRVRGAMEAGRLGAERGALRTRRLGATREGIRRRVGGVNVPGFLGSQPATGIPSIQTGLQQLEQIAKPKELRVAGQKAVGAAKQAAGAGKWKRRGLIGGGMALGIPLLLKAMSGGEKKGGAEITPEIQMQLMQAMGGGQGGTDPNLTTGRQLRNVFQLLQIIKTLRDMQMMGAQPTPGGLV
jgi:hypothetical protein